MTILLIAIALFGWTAAIAVSWLLIVVYTFVRCISPQKRQELWNHFENIRIEQKKPLTVDD